MLDAAPFPDLLDQGEDGAKGVYGEQLYRLPEPPCLTGEPISRGSYCSEALPSFIGLL